MPVEFERQGEPERRKLPAKDFLYAAGVHLEGLPLLKAFTNINLETDAEGNLAEHVVDNVKKLLTTAIGMIPDTTARHQFEKMKDFLEDY